MKTIIILFLLASIVHAEDRVKREYVDQLAVDIETVIILPDSKEHEYARKLVQEIALVTDPFYHDSEMLIQLVERALAAARQRGINEVTKLPLGR